MSADAWLLVLYVGTALSVSFLASLLEATLLSVCMSELESAAQDGNPGATQLLELKRNRLDDAISAILTLNTISQTLGAALAGPSGPATEPTPGAGRTHGAAH